MKRFTRLVLGIGTAALCSTTYTQAQEGSDLKIAVVLKTLANPYWVAMQQGIEAKAGEIGAAVTVQAGTDESAIDEQTSILQAMAGQDFNCFIVAPISSTNLIQPLVTVAANGHPIVAEDLFDADALKAAGVELATYITVRHSDAGIAAGEDMSKRLGGTGKVGLIGGLAGNPASVARLDGFRQGGAGLEVVAEQAGDWDREKALNAADAIIRAHPDIKGFYAANDGMALGVQQAVNNVGQTGNILVYGTDAIPDALDSIEAGQLVGTGAQFPYLMGTLGVEACVAALAGKDLPEETVAPIALITSDNVAEAKAAAPKPWFEFDSPLAGLVQ